MFLIGKMRCLVLLLSTSASSLCVATRNKLHFSPLKVKQLLLKCARILEISFSARSNRFKRGKKSIFRDYRVTKSHNEVVVLNWVCFQQILGHDLRQPLFLNIDISSFNALYVNSRCGIRKWSRKFVHGRISFLIKVSRFKFSLYRVNSHSITQVPVFASITAWRPLLTCNLSCTSGNIGIFTAWFRLRRILVYPAY